MNKNYTFLGVNQALPALMGELLRPETPLVPSRNGTTKELTHVGVTLLNPLSRYILVPGRKVNLAAQVAETVWVLAGHNSLEMLSEYLPRAKDFSDDGETWRAAYGQRMRRFGTAKGKMSLGVDQLDYVVKLLRKDPLTRQAVISLWDPEVDTEPGKDLPCNDWLCFTNRFGYLDLQVALRSNDIMWGWSNINQFEWSALLEIVAFLVGAAPGKLHFSTASFHLYDRHYDKARELAERVHDPVMGFTRKNPGFQLPGLYKVADLHSHLADWLRVERMIRLHGPDNLRVRDQVSNFKEPMLRSWLRVIQWWWSGGDYTYLEDLEWTPLYAAAQMALQPPTPSQRTGAVTAAKATSAALAATGGLALPQAAEVASSALSQFGLDAAPSPFLKATIKLHNEKSAAYGDSWKRRGEFLAILANIARKVDRLGGGETADETSVDTAMDLFVYLAKYRVWLVEQGVGKSLKLTRSIWNSSSKLTDNPDAANALMREVEVRCDRYITDKELGGFISVIEIISVIERSFEELEKEATEGSSDRAMTVDAMLNLAYNLARALWDAENEYRGADAD